MPKYTANHAYLSEYELLKRAKPKNGCIATPRTDTHKEFSGNYPTVSMAMVFDKWQELNELISKDIDPKPITPNKPKKKNVKKKQIPPCLYGVGEYSKMG